jgi:hypothetical protein
MWQKLLSLYHDGGWFSIHKLNGHGAAPTMFERSAQQNTRKFRLALSRFKTKQNKIEQHKIEIDLEPKHKASKGLLKYLNVQGLSIDITSELF